MPKRAVKLAQTQEHPAPTTDDSDIIRTNETAKIVGVPPGTIACWVSRKQIPHYRLTERLPVFSRKEILAWLAAKRVPVAVGE